MVYLYFLHLDLYMFYLLKNYLYYFIEDLIIIKLYKVPYALVKFDD